VTLSAIQPTFADANWGNVIAQPIVVVQLLTAAGFAGTGCLDGTPQLT
jgi:hypothetical protein